MCSILTANIHLYVSILNFVYSKHCLMHVVLMQNSSSDVGFRIRNVHCQIVQWHNSVVITDDVNSQSKMSSWVD